ncbi:2Fe-2S iron-sulfur cluster-binding family protein [Haliea atlantica]
MVHVTFNYRDGSHHTVESEEGNSLMMAAYLEGIPGIEGICGGVAACGTCHVAVAEPWLESCGKIDSVEEKRLEMVSGRQTNSRLACQITLDRDKDGMQVLVIEE